MIRSSAATALAVCLAAGVALLGCPTYKLAPSSGEEAADRDTGRPTTLRDAGGPTSGSDTGDPVDTALSEDVSDHEGDLADADDADEIEAQPPVARTAERLDGVVGTALAFDGSASSDPDGSIVAYDWDFGDGSWAGGEVVEHVYDEAGDYSASLTVKDEDGLSDTVEVLVYVAEPGNQPPTAIIRMPTTPVPVGEEVVFDGTPSNDLDGTIVAYSWSFRATGEDEEATAESGPSVTMQFDVVGEYEARLEVEDDRGAIGGTVEVFEVKAGPHAAFTYLPELPVVGQVVAFSAAESSDDGTILTYNWSFGDGHTDSGEEVDHAFDFPGEYEVALTLIDDEEMIGRASQTVAVATNNQAPVVVVGPNRLVGVGDEVVFDGSGSYDPDGALVAFLWEFGDGATATTARATHRYEVAGMYAASLTVGDDGGLTAEASVEVTVDTPPVAVIEVLTGSPASDAPVAFSGAASHDSDADDAIVDWAWDFGDGTGGAGATVDHSYAEPASYDVTLTVTDNLGLSALATETVEVGCGSDCEVSGAWRIRPYDTEETYTAYCNWYYDAVVAPMDCRMTQVGAGLSIDCGGGFVYEGTRVGDTFTVVVDVVTVLDPWEAWCGNIYTYERISGTFESATRWTGIAEELTLDFDDSWWDPDCAACSYRYDVTGTRVGD